jgi:hypothetical protein
MSSSLLGEGWSFHPFPPLRGRLGWGEGLQLPPPTCILPRSGGGGVSGLSRLFPPRQVIQIEVVHERPDVPARDLLAHRIRTVDIEQWHDVVLATEAFEDVA